MRYKTIILTLLLLIINNSSLWSQNQKEESGGLNSEDVALFLKTFDYQPIINIIPKVDELVNFGKDSTQKAKIAAYAFDYYYASKIMGYESIALYIADSYFLNNKYKYPSEEGAIMLNIFADFNRKSMIGMEAPQLILQDIDGKDISIIESKSDYKILYFYNENCSSCAIQTPTLMSFLSNIEGKHVTLYRIFCDYEIDRWAKYKQHLDTLYSTPANIEVIDLIDSQANTNFHKLYAVLSTPQMFLLDAKNIIIGRKLDTDALAKLINQGNEIEKKLETLVINLFTSLIPKDNAPDTNLVNYTIDVLYERSANSSDEFKTTLLFSIFQYLKASPHYEFQVSAAYLAEKYIIGKPIMWENFQKWKYTQRSFIDETRIALQKFNKNRLGSKGENITIYNSKNKKAIISASKEPKILFFFDIIEENDWNLLNKFVEISSNHDICNYQFFAVYIGKDKSVWKKLRKYHSSDIYTSKEPKSNIDKLYDLSTNPSIYILDNEMTIIGKDIEIDFLKEIINQ